MEFSGTDSRQGPTAWITVLVLVAGLVLLAAGVVAASAWLAGAGLLVLAAAIPIGLMMRRRGGGDMPGWSGSTRDDDVDAAAREPGSAVARSMDLPPGHDRGHLSASHEPVSPPPGIRGFPVGADPSASRQEDPVEDRIEGGWPTRRDRG